MNKKILLALVCAALLAVASLSACSSDKGTGDSLGTSGSIIQVPSSSDASSDEE
ncbi:MAG: hypothetical protein M0P13_07410 [Fibrobacteraceae bacterium]|nr:hypothetical protein [Fibrobacteraceae bacterium]